MIPELITQNSSGIEFLQGSIPIVLSLMLILMFADAMLEAKSHNKFKSEQE
ncbi:MAG: hypothetical protein AAB414_03575 [Patescibacteria group bacterium]